MFLVLRNFQMNFLTTCLLHQCNMLCDEGKQTRQVVCYQKKDGRIEVLDEKDCTEEKPEVEQPCFLQPCDEVDWVTSDWTGVSKRTKLNYVSLQWFEIIEINCIFHSTYRLLLFTLYWPTNQLIVRSNNFFFFFVNCSFFPQMPSSIIHSLWSTYHTPKNKTTNSTTFFFQCDSCTSKNRTRVVVCSTISRVVVNDSFCSYHNRPEDFQECDKSKLPECEVQWYATQWSKVIHKR